MPPIDPRKVPTDPRERAAWIVMQLRLRGLSLRRISQAHGWNPNNASQALYKPHLPAETAVAEALVLRF